MAGAGTDLGEFPRNKEKREYPIKIGQEVPREEGMKTGNIRGIPRVSKNRGIPLLNCVPGERGICNEDIGWSLNWDTHHS